MYFLLGIAIISLINEYLDINYKSVLIAIMSVFLYAVSDEVHQMFVVGRSGEILDVMFDTFGGILANISYLLYSSRRRFDE